MQKHGQPVKRKAPWSYYVKIARKKRKNGRNHGGIMPYGKVLWSEAHGKRERAANPFDDT